MCLRVPGNNFIKSCLNVAEPGSKKKLNFMAISNPLWLTCPFLNKKIHDFESIGYIKKITDLINSDRSLIELMKKRACQLLLFKKKPLFQGVWRDKFP